MAASRCHGSLHPGVVTAVRREGTREGRWTLLDYVDIVVHIQHQDERNFYALDRLWRDCPTIPVDLAGAEGAEGVDGAEAPE